MEIRANNDVTIEKIKVSREYKALEIVYVICSAIALIGFFMINSNINFIIIFGISFLGAMFMYWNKNKLKDKLYELNECYIRLSENYIEFKQLVNGEYQIGKIYIPDISSIMKVEEGFQIWYDTKTGNSRYMIDDDIVEAETVCVNFYAYDTEEYIDLYLEFIGKLTRECEKELDMTEWKEESDIRDWFKMMCPCFLYIILVLLSFI